MTKKHIKLEVFPTKWGYYIVRVIEQTHRWEGFGVGSEATFGRLLSAVGPSCSYSESGSFTFCVRGKSVDFDWEPFLVPSDLMDNLRHEIKLYNDFFSGEKKPKDNLEITGGEIIE